MLKENTKIFITTFTVTSLSGEEKTFPGPFIFANTYQEASEEASVLNIEIVGELDEETKLPILH
jgi:hypothetical protein